MLDQAKRAYTPLSKLRGQLRPVLSLLCESRNDAQASTPEKPLRDDERKPMTSPAFAQSCPDTFRELAFELVKLQH